MSEPILLVTHEHSAHGLLTTLTLNRPAQRNALSHALVAALQAALNTASTDGTRVLVLRGTGPVFCAGFDFSDIEALPNNPTDPAADATLTERFIAIEHLLQALYAAPFDTVALAQRAAVGAGADLVASCVHRVAEPGAKLRFPGARFGLVLGTRRLGERVGAHHAQALVGGDGCTAEAALGMGLLTQVAAEAEWPNIVAQVAAHAARVPAHTRAAVLASLRPAHEADAQRDLAALVASARDPSAGGLRNRIRQYLHS